MAPFRVLLIIFCLYATALLVSFVVKEKEPQIVVRTQTMVIPQDPDVFTPEKFKEYLKALNIRHYDVAYAQACLETGNFKSKAFIISKNLFGMKQAKSRPTTNSGEYLKHARYNHWRESVIDYALYYSKYLSKFKTQKSLLNYLSKHYATDSMYVIKIKNLIK
jgi:uncharacterized FlgJ-related protein